MGRVVKTETIKRLRSSDCSVPAMPHCKVKQVPIPSVQGNLKLFGSPVWLGLTTSWKVRWPIKECLDLSNPKQPLRSGKVFVDFQSHESNMGPGFSLDDNVPCHDGSDCCPGFDSCIAKLA